VADTHRVPVSVLDGRDRAVVTLDGRQVVLFHVDDRIHAFENRCPHEGNPLSEGEILGPTLTCVFHNWRFDLETGACLFGDLPARRFAAELTDGVILVRLD
jgi:nitrite reductase/ring-hydroxylating ferredoxin subunit